MKRFRGNLGYKINRDSMPGQRATVEIIRFISRIREALPTLQVHKSRQLVRITCYSPVKIVLNCEAFLGQPVNRCEVASLLILFLRRFCRSFREPRMRRG